jgi:hypothetical protein
MARLRIYENLRTTRQRQRAEMKMKAPRNPFTRRLHPTTIYFGPESKWPTPPINEIAFLKLTPKILGETPRPWALQRAKNLR